MAVKEKVLVAGASGLVGHAAIERFHAAGWEVAGVSRRKPSDLAYAELLSVDLLDAGACEAAFGEMGDVTHLVYAALQEDPGLFQGWVDPGTIERNAAMLRNLFEPLSRVAGGLKHVSLLHGTKAYGVHHPSIGPGGVGNPLREREPRRQHPNFYFEQEDYLQEKQRGASWSMTVFRPTVIYGDAEGNNMNPILPIAAYAAILREAGEPLHFPGSGGWRRVREAVDADLVGNALLWAATSAAAENETFNLTNGDVFTWAGVWGALADAMGMEAGEERPLLLVDELPRRQQEWAAIVKKYELSVPEDVVEFAGYNSVIYADMVMSGPRVRESDTSEWGDPILNSTIKGRQAGFQDCMDTEDMFRSLIERLQARGKVPPRN